MPIKNNFLSIMNKTMFAISFTLSLIALAFLTQKTIRNNKVDENLIPQNNIRIIDGDTFELNGKVIRLYGIDAFEKNQRCFKHLEEVNCGRLATEYLSFLLTGKNVICNKKSSDKYGRDVSICYVDKIDIGKMMVRQGWAKAYREYSTAYIQDEIIAKENLSGAWSKEFIDPKTQRGKIKNE